MDNDGKEKLDGFKSGYISNSKLESPQISLTSKKTKDLIDILYRRTMTRLTQKDVSTLLQDNTEGYVGISNFDYSESMLPSLAIRSTGNAIARIAENNGTTQAAVQLLGEENCLKYGTTLSTVAVSS